MKSIIALLFAIIVASVSFLVFNSGTSQKPTSETHPYSQSVQTEHSNSTQVPDNSELNAIENSVMNQNNEIQINKKPLESLTKRDATLETSKIAPIALTQENVPPPLLAFGRNVALTWEDYLAILELFELHGSPISYIRKSSDSLFFGEWWVKHQGYDDAGNSTFEIVDLNEFTTKSYEIREEITDYELNDLFHDTSFGEISSHLENTSLDNISQFSTATESIICRQKKCLFKLKHAKDSNFDIVAFTKLVVRNMEVANPSDTCTSSWSPLKHGNLIRVVCAD